MKSSFRKKTSSGFSITELLVATGLVSVIFLVGSSVITQLFSFQKDMNTRMMDNFSVVSFHKALTSDLEGAYWPRYDGFNCKSSQNLMTTDGSETVNLDGKDGFFEFVTADFSSTVGVVPDSGELSVASMRNLAVGDYVILSLATTTSTASLFKVSKVDRAKGRLVIAPSNLDVGSGSDCQSTLGSKSLTDFFSPSVKSNVILTRVFVVQYSLKGGQLSRNRLPGQTGDKVLDQVKSMSISSKWTTSSEESSQKYGQMDFNVKINANMTSLMGQKNRIDQTSSIQAKYALNSFQYLNQYSQTGAPTVNKKFPTCSVAATFQPGSLKFAPGESAFKNMIPVNITGYSSESLQMPTIDVSFTPESGGDIMCYKNDNATEVKSVTGVGIRGSISLTQPGGSFDLYTCAAKGRIQVSSSMSYFDNDLNQVKTIVCSADYIDAPTKYVFNGKMPSCNRSWGTMKMGDEIFSEDGSVSLGNFSVDMNASCEWEHEEKADSKTTGVSEDCYAWNHWGHDLKRVYLRPYQIQVFKKAGGAAFDSSGAYIDCN